MIKVKIKKKWECQEIQKDSNVEVFHIECEECLINAGKSRLPREQGQEGLLRPCTFPRGQ